MTPWQRVASKMENADEPTGGNVANGGGPGATRGCPKGHPAANLPEALKNLHDDQLELLLKDVSLEIERRKSAALPKAPPVEATRQWQRGRHRNKPPWQAPILMRGVTCLKARPI